MHAGSSLVDTMRHFIGRPFAATLSEPLYHPVLPDSVFCVHRTARINSDPLFSSLPLNRTVWNFRNSHTNTNTAAKKISCSIQPVRHQTHAIYLTSVEMTHRNGIEGPVEVFELSRATRRAASCKLAAFVCNLTGGRLFALFIGPVCAVPALQPPHLWRKPQFVMIPAR